ncbi:MAG TPA: APC family permease [Candidatus Acidoferrales bacterium]|nr:APC family permease [Candidatus Acidoferrales bacterium]
MTQFRRSLGFVDVVLFFVIACTNLQWVATAAAAGPQSLTVWLIGAFAMFFPLSLVVMKLGSRFPDEGGMYVWSKRAFGPLAGFMTGWTYWCSNLPYFPALMYFTAGNALFIWGGGTQLSGSPAYYVAFSLIAFGFATALNVFGLGTGKWLVNVAAAGRWIVTIGLIAVAVASWMRFGSATPIDAASLRPSAHLRDLIFWSVIAFAWTGPESIPFMGAEIKDSSRSMARGLGIAAPAIAAIYIFGTASVLVTLPAAHVSAIYGVMQAIERGGSHLGWGAIVPVAGVLVTISCLGSAGAWLASIARIPLVAGIDRYLPPVFGRVDPRSGSPVVALLTQAVISALFIIAGQSGSSVKDAYDIMVSATVLITMIPFAFLFASALKLHPTPLVIGASILGLVTTFGAMLLSLFPADGETNATLSVIKVLLLTALMLGGGAAIYVIGARKRDQHAIETV